MRSSNKLSVNKQNGETPKQQVLVKEFHVVCSFTEPKHCKNTSSFSSRRKKSKLSFELNRQVKAEVTIFTGIH